MKLEDANELIEALASIDPSTLDLVEQATMLAAMEAFATAVKPIVIRHCSSNNGPSAFLFKL